MSPGRRLSWVLLAIGFTTLAMAPPAGAFTIFQVNDTSDLPDANTGDGICATSVVGTCTLRAAVEEANAFAGNDGVVVPAGTFDLTINGGGALEITSTMFVLGVGARSTVIRQERDDGQGIGDRVFDIQDTAATVTISDVTVANGWARDSVGFFGGNVRSVGTLTVIDSSVRGGRASSGGAIANVGGALTVQNSTISGNSAPDGGGDSGAIQNFETAAGADPTLTVVNSTISGNSARSGGGIFTWHGGSPTPGGGTITILNSTITGNTSTVLTTTGGGLHLSAGVTATVQNSIISGNNGGGLNCTTEDASAVIVSAGNNVENGTDCDFEAAGDLQTTDPLLGPLVDNGGGTDTHAIDEGSPAAHAGNDAACPSSDQREYARPRGSACDIGAFEWHPPPSAAELALAASSMPVTVTSLPEVPPNGSPLSVFGAPLASLPTAGPSFAVLSSGDASVVQNASQAATASTDNGGAPSRGNTDMDVSILKAQFEAPASANCLSIDFRFLSEEFPEFVGATFNDGFIAELDTSDWTTDGALIAAPHNFAFDPLGEVISVDAAGVTSMSAAQAFGTVFDGATPLLRASTPVTAGAHVLYLSIFDQGDASLDSAVFVDNARLESRPAGECVPGAVLRPEPLAGGPGSSPSVTPSVTQQQRPPLTLEDLPEPVLARSINVQARSGVVLVGIPAGAAGSRRARASQKGVRFVPLEEARQIPMGSFLDTRRGSVDLVAATGSGDRTQAGVFASGLFQVLQSRERRARGLTELRLKGSSFNRCRARGGAATGRPNAAQLSRRTIRRLRANAKGRFRTRGRHSAATVRGTVWITADRCDGTLTSVKRGKVAVRDLRRKRTVVVKAGKSYLARAPR